MAAPVDTPKFMVELENLKREVFLLLNESLPKELSYHTVKHTQDVFDVSRRISELYMISGRDQYLLLTAALFHDTGFIAIYKGHEEESVRISREILGAYDYENSDLDKIAGMIRATKIPQSPLTFLEKIICDADLDYLGRDDFYTTGSLLFAEYLSYGFVKDEREFDEVQISFLESHDYHTGYSKLTRGKRKERHLEELRAKTYQSI